MSLKCPPQKLMPQRSYIGRTDYRCPDPGQSAIRFKKLDRSVVVKGLAEMEVDATLAIWPITFNEAGNNLSDLQSALEDKQTIILEFLKENGFADEEISIGMINISDQKANFYGGR